MPYPVMIKRIIGNTALNVNKDILKIKLNNNANDFFLPIAGDTFFVKFSNGVVVAFSQSGEF